MKMRWNTRVESSLDHGLHALEKARSSSLPTDAVAVDKWKGDLMAAMPPDTKFIGRPFTFSIIDSELIVDHIMSKHDYHKNSNKDAAFAIAVQCFAHYGAVCSTWVYVGCVTPHAKAKKKDEDDPTQKKKGRDAGPRKP